MHQFQWIYDWVLAQAMSPWALLVVFACCLIDGFFPPIPSESVVTALGAVLVAKDPLRLIPLTALAAFGAFVGDNIAYLIGSKLHGVLARFPKLERSVHDASGRIARRGAVLIITGRFIPVGRVAINMGAGLADYPHHRFVLVTALSGTIWGSYAVVIGVLAGHWIESNPLLGATIGVVLGVTIGVIVDRIIQARQKRQVADVAEAIQEGVEDDHERPGTPPRD
ncbi:DedA family protein [Nigerium massiliense]|uniref:DedA family protein n=1 Tax=Nigerium massiliense TaxID=1522317 RepID=UPI000693D308|nr:DedA family protein [Nigerium massiliense]